VKRWLLSAGLLVAAVAGAQDAALQVVESCRARLDPRVDIGTERVTRRCPELIPALERAPWRELLPSTLRERNEEISADSLGALVELVRRAGDPGERRAGPDQTTLEPVLAELGQQGQQGATRWERFKHWLKEKFENRKRNDEPGWLEKWSRQFRTSEGIVKAITQLGYVLVAALVLFVIWAELRAAGLLGGRRREQGRDSPAVEWRRRLMLTDVMAAQPFERPGMMLTLLGEALARARRLPAADSLPAGEIARRARLETEAERVELAQVASTAEKVRYAPQPPAEQDIDGAVTTARELLGKFARLPPERG
jgi:hypothetical protein